MFLDISRIVYGQNYGAFFDNIKNGILGPVKLVAPNHEEKDLSQNTWAYKVGMGGIDQKQLYLNLPHQSWHSSQKSLPINRMFVWYKVCFHKYCSATDNTSPLLLLLALFILITYFFPPFSTDNFWHSFGTRPSCIEFARPW